MTDDRERLEEMAVSIFPGSDPKRLGPIEWRCLALDLLRQLREREWQPIETAPKDGTLVDLWHPIFGRISDACWHRGVWNTARGDDFTEFTHWQPLPAPPNKEDEHEV